jgi:DNA polymerase III delta' subunit
LEVLTTDKMERKLLAYVAGDKVHPALILGGPGSETKAKIARRMAKALLCPKKQSLPPFCGVCSTCRRVEAGTHPDVLWLAPTEESLKIDSVRELCHQMELTPVEGGHKIAVIEDCHRMNTASANAFLKSLEEPGPNRHFWLLTPLLSSLLPTVVSRCLVFHFPPPAEALSANAEMENLLTEVARSGDFHALAAQLKDKDKCLELVNYLQVQWRLTALHPFVGENPAQVFQSASLWESLILFEEAVQLEGRLRSNASSALLVESHLRNTFTERAQ